MARHACIYKLLPNGSTKFICGGEDKTDAIQQLLNLSPAGGKPPDIDWVEIGKGNNLRAGTPTWHGTIKDED